MRTKTSPVTVIFNVFKYVVLILAAVVALIPGIATQVTVYQIMYSLGLINHLYGYMIVLMGTDIISIYIFLQFFENLPVSLDESAIMDGCTYFGVFFKILFPLLKPAIVILFLVFQKQVYGGMAAGAVKG